MTNEIIKMFKKIMVETGRARETDTVIYVGIDGEAYSDYRMVNFVIVKKGCKHPYIYWSVFTNMASGLVRFDKSEAYPANTPKDRKALFETYQEQIEAARRG